MKRCTMKYLSIIVMLGLIFLSSCESNDDSSSGNGLLGGTWIGSQRTQTDQGVLTKDVVLTLNQEGDVVTGKREAALESSKDVTGSYNAGNSTLTLSTQYGNDTPTVYIYLFDPNADTLTLISMTSGFWNYNGSGVLSRQ